MTSYFHFPFLLLILFFFFCFFEINFAKWPEMKKKNDKKVVVSQQNVYMIQDFSFNAEKNPFISPKLYKYVRIYMLIICSKILSAGMDPFGRARICKAISALHCCCCCLSLIIVGDIDIDVYVVVISIVVVVVVFVAVISFDYFSVNFRTQCSI